MLDHSPVQDGEWFEYSIKVEGKRIIIQINGKTTVDYTEPENPDRPANMKNRLVDHGTFALQAHDPVSKVYFRNIRVRPLE